MSKAGDIGAGLCPHRRPYGHDLGMLELKPHETEREVTERAPSLLDQMLSLPQVVIDVIRKAVKAAQGVTAAA